MTATIPRLQEPELGKRPASVGIHFIFLQRTPDNKAKTEQQQAEQQPPPRRNWPPADHLGQMQVSKRYVLRIHDQPEDCTRVRDCGREIVVPNAVLD